MSIHFSSTMRKRTGRQCHSKLWLWLCFCNKFPCNSVLNMFKEMVCDVSVTYLFIPFTIRIQEAAPFRNRDSIKSSIPYVLDEDRPSHPRPGRFSCFRESTLSLGALLRFEVTCTLNIDFSFHLVLLPKCEEELSFSTIFKPAPQQSLDNFWSSGSCSNFRS